MAFNYFGGKYNHAEWIINRLPVTRTYVEVFGGSAVILLNRKPSRIECYNDINSTVVNFFLQLRENTEQLIDAIYLTPYSREEYFRAYKTLNEGTPLERARKFYIVVNQSFNGSYSRQTGWKMSTIESRANISEALNRWLSKPPYLKRIVERLKTVQISNFDFRLIFEKFDDPDTLFYCDPPYTHDTRCNNNEYEYEMSTADHQGFLNLCLNAKSKIAISGYENEVYEFYLKDFYKSTAKEKRGTLMHSSRKEVLWSNYNPQEIHHNLFNNNYKE